MYGIEPGIEPNDPRPLAQQFTAIMDHLDEAYGRDTRHLADPCSCNGTIVDSAYLTPSSERDIQELVEVAINRGMHPDLALAYAEVNGWEPLADFIAEADNR